MGLHLRGGQPFRIEHDRQRFAAELIVGKYIDGHKMELHISIYDD